MSNPKRIAVFAASVMVVIATAAQAQANPAATAPARSAAPQQVSSAEVFARWDTDHNKSLSQQEFKAGWDQVQANMLVYKLHENFLAMDANKDGALEASEYANLELVRKAGASAPPMSSFDVDKSQTLDFKEYLGFVKAMVKSKP